MSSTTSADLDKNLNPQLNSLMDLRPLDVDRLGHMNSIVVRAGAGAGKTTELVDRVLSIAKKFYQKNKRWPRLVVTTFTRKATHELRQRLLERALDLNEPELVDFLRRRSLVHISTIHGVLSLFLHRYGSRMGLAPEYQLIGTLDEEKSIRRSLRRLIQKDSAAAESFVFLLQSLSLPMLEKELKNFFDLSMQHSDLITPSLSDLRQKMDDEFSKTKKLSKDLVESIQNSDLPESWNEFAVGLSAALQMDTRAALLNFIDGASVPRASKKNDAALNDLKSEVSDRLKALGEFQMSENFLETYQQYSEHFLSLYEKWSQAWIQEKIKSSQLTMNDLEVLSLFLIKTDSAAARDFSAEWDYWLIDEYQDTSPRQVQLLKSMVGDRNSFVVGDPQQSIYLFRGARSEVFHERELELQNSGGELIPKMENYRSRPELLEFFNHFFTSLSPQFQPMIPLNNKGAVVDPKNPVAIFYNKEFDLRQQKDQAEIFETKVVASRVQELLGHGVSPEQICVLGRSNKELHRLSLAVLDLGIPIQVHSSSQFFQRREIRDALAFLKFILNPHDSVNCIELLRSPWARISDADLAQIASASKNSFWEAAKKTSDQPAIERLKKSLAQSQELGIGTAWVEALKESALIDYSKNIDPSGRREANLWKLILNIRSLEKKPGFNYLEYIEKLDQADLDTEGGDADAVPVIEPQRVNFMTVHASKGLQFEHVIISRMGTYRSQVKTPFLLSDEKSGHYMFCPPDPQDQKWTAPLQGLEMLETLKEREFAEYDRLLYVALTRAKTSVALIWTGKDKNSWAARMWKPTVVGSQSLEKYQVEYRDQALEISSSVVTAVDKIPIISKIDSAATIPHQKFSVTQYLNQMPVQTVSTPAALAEDIFSLAQKAQSGVDAHRVFESMKYATIGTKNPEVTKAVQFLKTWENGLIANLIKEGHPEWGFTVRFHNKIIQGQIDLWGVDSQNKLWILDYKTGSMAYKQKAFTQLQIYSYALRTIRTELQNLSSTTLAVVYPMQQQVVLEPAMSLQQIELQLLKD